MTPSHTTVTFATLIASRAMGCLVVLLAFISARLALFFVWIFTDDISRAFDNALVPILGFFLLPWTTLAYVVLWSTGTHGVHGFEVFLVIFAFIVDLGSYAGGGRAQAQRAASR